MALIAAENLLIHGDNLEAMRRYVDDGSVGFIYCDPPFLLQKPHHLARQIGPYPRGTIAYDDRWAWDERVAAAYEELMRHKRLRAVFECLQQLAVAGARFAYLVFLAERLLECSRVLDPRRGSIILHLPAELATEGELLLDAVFGRSRCRNRIVWRRAGPNNNRPERALPHHYDVLLWYVMSEAAPYHPPADEPVLIPPNAFETEDGRVAYWDSHYFAPRPSGISWSWRIKRKIGEHEWQTDHDNEWQRPKEGWEYRAIQPPPGRSWFYSYDTLKELDAQGRIRYTRTGSLRILRYVDEKKPKPMGDFWEKEDRLTRLPYPTAKPLALLERIVAMATDQDQLVLDPFAGGGTTLIAATRLFRRWIGIDASPVAIAAIQEALQQEFRGHCSYQLIALPSPPASSCGPNGSANSSSKALSSS